MTTREVLLRVPGPPVRPPRIHEEFYVCLIRRSVDAMKQSWSYAPSDLIRAIAKTGRQYPDDARSPPSQSESQCAWRVVEVSNSVRHSPVGLIGHPSPVVEVIRDSGNRHIGDASNIADCSSLPAQWWKFRDTLRSERNSRRPSCRIHVSNTTIQAFISLLATTKTSFDLPLTLAALGTY